MRVWASYVVVYAVVCMDSGSHHGVATIGNPEWGFMGGVGDVRTPPLLFTVS